VSSKFDVGARKRLASILISRNADVVHTQGSPAIDLFAAAAARTTKTPLVVTRPVMIADLQISNARRSLYKIVDKYTLRHAAAIVAVSSAGLEHLANTTGHRSKIRLIYNGVDLQRFAEPTLQQRARFGLSPHCPVVGACGQLTSNKAWDEFLVAVQKLRATIPDLEALIVGDGPLRHDLEKKRDELGLSRAVHFAGHLHDVESALACLDVYLFMSKVEGLSVALIEAMAASRACVVTNVGGTREQIVDGAGGFVVEPGDVPRAVAKTKQILEQATLRRQMGEFNRRRATDLFDVKQMVRGYWSSYEDAIDYGKRETAAIRTPSN
jgi:glycosyltransferase involved in cell wall biosynthesis